MQRPFLLVFLSSLIFGACSAEPDSNDLDQDGYSGDVDCDDQDPNIHPGAIDLPGENIGESNGVDEDCNGDFAVLCYVDADNDEFGSSTQLTATAANGNCLASANLANNADDCADNDARINPGLDEVCDGLDNDCNGAVDNDLDESAWNNGYVDADGDGDGDANGVEIRVCAGGLPLAQENHDCDDQDAATYGGDNPATEVCDGKDNDCDGAFLDGEAPGQRVDSDQDGFFTCPNTDDCTLTFDLDGNQVGTPQTWDPLLCGDCNDIDPTIHPDSYEMCNDGINSDCDEFVDETEDEDQDGYETCDIYGDPWDCNDGHPQIYPGAEEILCDRIDNDCDPATDGDTADEDGDGTTCADDCDDGNPAVYPGATETCNQVDDDCNGIADNGIARVLIYSNDSAMSEELRLLLDTDDPGPSYCSTNFSEVESLNGGRPVPDLHSFDLVIIAPDMANEQWTWAGQPGPNAFTGLIEDSFYEQLGSGPPQNIPSLLGMGYAGKALFTDLNDFGYPDENSDGFQDFAPDLAIATMAVQCGAQATTNCSLLDAANPPGWDLEAPGVNPCAPLNSVQEANGAEPFFTSPNPMTALNQNFVLLFDNVIGYGRAYPLWPGMDTATPPIFEPIGIPGCDQNQSGTCWPGCGPQFARTLVGRHTIYFPGEALPGTPPLEAGQTMLYHWGWDAGPNDWSYDGRSLFKNIVYWAAACPPDDPNCNPPAPGR